MFPELTNRENEVLEQIVDGFTNREISKKLLISESTVENHIHNIYTKLGISNRTQAVVHAIQAKIIYFSEMIDTRGIPSWQNADTKVELLSLHYCHQIIL